MSSTHSKLRFPVWGWLLIGVSFVATVALAVWLLRYADDETVKKAAGVGDAAAVIATLFTAGALVATMWQAHLQRESVEAQVEEMVDTRDVLKAQAAEAKALVELQKELLAYQREQLGHQRADMRARGVTELRRAYADWFAAADAWLGVVLNHARWLQGDGATVDRPARARAVGQLNVERDKMLAAQWLVMLTEPNEARRREVHALCEPIKSDIPEKVPDPKPTVVALGAEVADIAGTRYRALVALEERLRADLFAEGGATVAPTTG